MHVSQPHQQYSSASNKAFNVCVKINQKKGLYAPPIPLKSFCRVYKGTTLHFPAPVALSRPQRVRAGQSSGRKAEFLCKDSPGSSCPGHSQLIAAHLSQNILLRLSRNKDVLGDDHQEANASMDPVVVLNMQLSFREWDGLVLPKHHDC